MHITYYKGMFAHILVPHTYRPWASITPRAPPTTQ